MPRIACHLLVLTSLSLFTFSSVLATESPASAPAATQKAPSAAEIKALIDKLGDSTFRVRAAAQKDLVSAGPAALPALQEATKSQDAEVKQRAQDTINQINDAVAKAVSEAMAKNFMWAYAITNVANSTPAVSDGKAFVAGDGKLHAIDVKTGKIAWRADLPQNLMYVSSISVGAKVVAVSQMQWVVAYDIKDGKELWKKEVAQPAGRVGGGAAIVPGGNPGGGGVGGGVIVARPPIKAVPLDTAPASGPAAKPVLGPYGNPLPASAPASKPAASAPAASGKAAADDAPAVQPLPAPVARPPLVIGGVVGMPGRSQSWVVGDVVVSLAGEKLKAFKADTGDDAWEMTLKSPSPMCSAVLDGKTLYVVQGKSLTAIDISTRKELWSKETETPTLLLPCSKTILCSIGGKLTAFDAAKGDKKWEADLPAAGGIGNPRMVNVMGNRTIVVDDARAYMLVGSELTTFDLQKGDKATLSLDMTLPKQETEDTGSGAAAGQPAIGWVGASNAMMTRLTAKDGIFYVATDRAVFAFDGKTGARLWLLPVSLRIAADPVVAEGIIFLPMAKAFRPGMVAAEEHAKPADRPGLHAVKLPK